MLPHPKPSVDGSRGAPPGLPPDHDPLVCNIDLDRPSLCPGCRAEAARHADTDPDTAAEHLRLAWGLPRRPRPLPRDRRQELVLGLLDLLFTLRTDRQLRELLQTIIADTRSHHD